MFRELIRKNKKLSEEINVEKLAKAFENLSCSAIETILNGQYISAETFESMWGATEVQLTFNGDGTGYGFNGSYPDFEYTIVENQDGTYTITFTMLGDMPLFKDNTATISADLSTITGTVLIGEEATEIAMTFSKSEY